MKTLCNCGCNKIVDINPQRQPINYEVIDYYTKNYESIKPNVTTRKILSFKRLSDNKIFKRGDTIRRITINGKKHKRAVIFDIKEYSIGSKPFNIQLHAWIVDEGGLVKIDNDKPFINSNKNPNLLETIY